MSETVMISVCIPAYSMGGKGASYLEHSLRILDAQTYRQFEVIIADQSDDNLVKDISNIHWSFPVKYLSTRHLKRQASANINAAMDASKSRIVKILFQDDYLNGADALLKIADLFLEPDVHWTVSGSEHTFDGMELFRHHTPRFHDQIHYGKNTVSSPSVLAFVRESAPRFDENLVWLMDVDFYRQCADLWGHPKICSEALVVNRVHGEQVSAGIRRQLKRRELRYIRKKYAERMKFHDHVHYLWQQVKTFI